MKQIAKFYTLFWIIYFPLCIAFADALNRDWLDEALTVTLLLYAFAKSRYLVKNRKRAKEIQAYLCIMGFYLVYSLFMGVTTSRGVFLDFMQQLRPYAVFYLTWILAPNFTQKQKKYILAIMLVSFFTYLIIFKINPAILIGFYATETAALGQLALCCGMLYFLFTKPTQRNKYISIIIMLLGLFSGKSKYFGECIVFIFLVTYLKDKIKFNSIKTYLQTIILVSVVLFFTWTKFNAYYVEGMQEDAEEMARPATYKTGLQIMYDYFPFGSGLGSFGSAAAAKEYSPLYYKYHLDNIWGLTPENPNFLADTFYPIVYSQFGLVGSILFLIFWRRRLLETNRIISTNHYKMALMCILALALESTADSSYLSGKGMGYFMILAMCLNSNRNMEVQQKRKEQTLTPTLSR